MKRQLQFKLTMIYFMYSFYFIFSEKIFFSVSGSDQRCFRFIRELFYLDFQSYVYVYRLNRGKVVIMIDTVLDFALTHNGQVIAFFLLIALGCLAALLIERLDKSIKRRVSVLKRRARRFLPAYRLCKAQLRQLKRKRRTVALEGIHLILAFLRG